MTLAAIVSLIRLRARVLAGKIFNLAGVPGIVRDCDYDATVYNARIKVRAGDLFTIITVDGLDIYFHRLTGSIDGVGASNAPSGSLLGKVRESMPLPDPSVLSHRNAQKHSR